MVYRSLFSKFEKNLYISNISTIIVSDDPNREEFFSLSL